MIPSIGTLNTTITEVEIPTYTHKVLTDTERVSGHTDNLEAMRQAVYLILCTERYEFPIYSWDYGIELQDLFGRQMTYVIPTLRQRIIDALLQDDRITAVDNFTFTPNKNKLAVTFTVTTTFGNIDSGMEVAI